MPKTTPLTGSKPVKSVDPVKPNKMPPAPVKSSTPVKADTPVVVDSVKITPADTKELTKSVKSTTIPAWLQKNNMPEVAERNMGGYTGFASSQSLKWPMQQQAGLEDGQPFLYHRQQYIPLHTLNFFLLAGEKFQTLMVGREGKIPWASRDVDVKGPTVGSNKPEVHYVCLMIVDVDGEFIPMKGDFRGTKSGGIEGAIRSIEAAAEPEWLKLSESHRITALFPQPWGRVYQVCSTSYHVSKSSGNSYYRANCTSNPATIKHMQALLEAFNDDEFKVALDEARWNYNARVAFFDAIVAKGPMATDPGK